jgi:hypothetical protein
LPDEQSGSALSFSLNSCDGLNQIFEDEAVLQEKSVAVQIEND